MKLVYKTSLPHKIKFNIITHVNYQACKLAYAFAIYQNLDNKVNNIANALKPLLFRHEKTL